MRSRIDSIRQADSYANDFGGHITKGQLAGPKLLEHMVDTVLQFEDRNYVYRILRGKNRFGNTSELGIYEMQSNGLKSEQPL